MFADFIVPETEHSSNGESEAIALEGATGKTFRLTLGITRILEQQSLDVAIAGSADGQEWEEKPLITFPQKFYCGDYGIDLDLSGRPEIAYLKATWKMGRWGRGAPKPLFDFFIFVEETAGAATAARS